MKKRLIKFAALFTAVILAAWSVKPGFAADMDGGPDPGVEAEAQDGSGGGINPVPAGEQSGLTTPPAIIIEPFVIIESFNPEPYSSPDDPDTHHILVDYGTPADEIPLPGELPATEQGGAPDALLIPVAAWECAGYMDYESDVSGELIPCDYNPFTPNVYIFTPVPDLPDNFTISAGAVLPRVEVVLMQNFNALMGIMPLLAPPSLVAQINAIPYLTASLTNPNVINVTGSAASLNSTLNLNIDPGVTVNWDAELSGTLNGAYILSLTGPGNFNVAQNGRIVNNGTGGAVNISGAGGTLNVSGTVSAGSGFSVNVAGNNAVVNVLQGGTVTNPGSNSAINVAASMTDVVINVTGGTVISQPNGYAINDNGAADGDTEINVTNGGRVSAGIACAIHSTGGKAVTTVTDGYVSNSAASDSNPVIYMKGPSVKDLVNIKINGGSVVETTDTTSTTSYVIQTTCDVEINDNASVIAYRGRAINLVGTYSKAVINGGLVTATTGVAICTATTNPATVSYAEIIVNGGVVSTTATDGVHGTCRTIYSTGDYGQVRIEGGWVYTASDAAEAIYMQGAHSVCTVNGGWVSATGYFAINASGSVRLNGGFVFAYGTKPFSNQTGAGVKDSVVGAASQSLITYNAAEAVVVAWDDKNTPSHVYTEGENKDLTAQPDLDKSDYFWHYQDGKNGIKYNNGSNDGFFPLPVIITEKTESRGLEYDIGIEKFILDGSLYTGQSDKWGIYPNGTLWLKDFQWITNAPVALTIVNGTSLTIELSGTNAFVSTDTSGAATNAGINNAAAADLTITGSGTLNASASSGSGIDASGCEFIIKSGTVNATVGSGGSEQNHGITAESITVSGGALNASTSKAGNAALPSYGINANTLELEKLEPGEGVITASSGGYTAIAKTMINLPDGYTYWAGTQSSGGNAVMYNVTPDSSGDEEYSFKPTNRYVKIQALAPHTLTVNNGTGGGSYYAGQAVTVTALNPQGPVGTSTALPDPLPDSRDTFTGWTSDNGGTFNDSSAPSTVFIMPDNDVTICQTVNTAYRFHVVGGSFDSSFNTTSEYGYFFPGAQIPINSTNPQPDNEYFTGWVSDPTATEPFDTHSAHTVFTMPAFSVEVKAETKNYNLTTYHKLAVINGTGSGDNYLAGTKVEIIAAAAPLGMEFDKWQITYNTNDGVFKGTFLNINSASTYFTMGDDDVTVEALYRDINYTLHVINGSGSTVFIYGDAPVTITANPPPAGQKFKGWTADNSEGKFADAGSAATTYTLPARDATVTAAYEDNFYSLTVYKNGANPTVMGQYKMGDHIDITAGVLSDPDYEFSHWEILNNTAGSFDNAAVSNTKFIMPSFNVEINAVFTHKLAPPPVLYKLTVNSGVIMTTGGGSGEFPAGATVAVKSYADSADFTFSGWEKTSGGGTFTDAGLSNATFIMPAGDAVITAVFKHPYTDAHPEKKLTVKYGTGSGDYKPGTVVNISADDSQGGNHFTGWVINTPNGEGIFANPSNTTTTFIMPNMVVEIEATYAADKPKYPFTVEGGHIDGGTGPMLTTGEYEAGDVIKITADPPAGMMFDGWHVSGFGEVKLPYSRTTYFIMPASAATVTATLHVPYELTVVNGSGSGSYQAGAYITVTADAPPNRMSFDKWTGPGANYLNDASQPSAVLIMPPGNTSVTAAYGYKLTVVNGSGGGVYPENAEIPITANTPPSGKVFDKWIVSGANDSALSRVTSSSAVFTMPAGPVTITATYKDAPPYTPEPKPSPEPATDRGQTPATRPSPPAADDITDDETDTVIPPVFPQVEEYNWHLPYVEGIGGGLFAPELNITRAEAAQIFYNLLPDKDVAVTKLMPDVPAGAWYYTAVNTLATLGVIEGYPDGNYYPMGYITRAEFTTLAVKFTGEKLYSQPPELFDDVPESHWAYDIIEAAISFDWIEGTDGVHFEPDRYIMRSEAVRLVNQLLSRYPDKPYIDTHDDLLRFTDVPASYWAYYEIMEAYNEHIYMKEEETEFWMETEPPRP